MATTAEHHLHPPPSAPILSSLSMNDRIINPSSSTSYSLTKQSNIYAPPPPIPAYSHSSSSSSSSSSSITRSQGSQRQFQQASNSALPPSPPTSRKRRSSIVQTASAEGANNSIRQGSVALELSTTLPSPSRAAPPPPLPPAASLPGSGPSPAKLRKKRGDQRGPSLSDHRRHSSFSRRLSFGSSAVLSLAGFGGSSNINIATSNNTTTTTVGNEQQSELSPTSSSSFFRRSIDRRPSQQSYSTSNTTAPSTSSKQDSPVRLGYHQYSHPPQLPPPQLPHHISLTATSERSSATTTPIQIVDENNPTGLHGLPLPRHAFDFGTSFAATAPVTPSDAHGIPYTPLTPGAQSSHSLDYFAGQSPKRLSKSYKNQQSPRRLLSAADSVENLHRRRNSQGPVNDLDSFQFGSTGFDSQDYGQPQFSSKDPGSSTHVETRQRKTSVGLGAGDEPRRKKSKDRREKDKDKKAMLSRALQMAHRAVILDNEQNFEGAVEAYADACALLHQVLQRSSGEDDRRKLEAIRTTYEHRVMELRQLSPNSQVAPGKPLPARPMSGESSTVSIPPSIDSNLNSVEAAVIETAVMSRIVSDPSSMSQDETFEHKPKRISRLTLASPLTHSDSTSTVTVVASDAKASNPGLMLRLDDGRTHSPLRSRFLTLESPLDTNFLPPPLSPRPPISPSSSQLDLPLNKPPEGPLPEPPAAKVPTTKVPASRVISTGDSMSWLDTIDESGQCSPTSSVHSVDSIGLKRKRIRPASSGTEAEFDAALDAAVEAAYGDELEPFEYDGYHHQQQYGQQRQQTLPNSIVLGLGDLAITNDDSAQREELIRAAHERSRQLKASAVRGNGNGTGTGFNNDNDAEDEDEERLLDSLAGGPVSADDFDFGLQSKAIPPRQSDSSAYSHSTWHSSVSSNRNTAGTSLTTVNELNDGPTGGSKIPTGLPVLDEEARMSLDIPFIAETTSRPGSRGAGVRNRRLSGARQLTIETSIPSANNAPKSADPYSSANKQLPIHAGELLPSSVFIAPGTANSQRTLGPLAPPPRSMSASPLSGPSPLSGLTNSPGTPLLYGPLGETSAMFHPPSPGPGQNPSRSPVRLPTIKKNKSALSLNNHRNFVASSPDISDASPGTPMSLNFTNFSNGSRKALGSSGGLLAATPTIAGFVGVDLVPSAGLSLFESDIHSPMSPGIPNPHAQNAPVPLEPCPDSFLLRPFWLMRCFYQTIAHPRGGYLSTKLFVPRDAWKVKGVKIKNIEDKIASCDLLTAALQKLAAVDTYDADAVHEEMQVFEHVLDQVQAILSKKLGADVGMANASSMFKDFGSTPSSGHQSASGHHNDNSSSHSDMASLASRSMSQGKSYLSWRKLRSKTTSNHNGPTSIPSSSGLSSSRDGSSAKDSHLTISTLPMTSLLATRFPKRDLATMDISGPHALYMGSLARLCDAVQVIDQIARQVEDPGLRHSSSTHVGLELCTRHASEFFGFYICRFVLGDLALLIDKFLKRGSEWVLM